MRLLAALLVLALLAAGCSGPSDGLPADDGAARALAGSLEFPSLDVVTTPDEPNEPRHLLRVAWSAQAFGIESQTEGDLAQRTVVRGAEAYTSATGMGWIRDATMPAVASGLLSNRLLLWDLRAILQDPGVAVWSADEGGRAALHAKGTLHGTLLDVDLRVVHEGGKAVEAFLDSTKGREAPYTFVPAPPLSFPVEVPGAARLREDVAAGDAAAQEAHTALLRLVEAYRQNHVGTLPDRLDPDTLRVELAASGGVWPVNPYSGQGIADADLSGGFDWKRCGLGDGRYVGHGWDGPLATYGFGAPCA